MLLHKSINYVKNSELQEKRHFISCLFSCIVQLLIFDKWNKMNLRMLQEELEALSKNNSKSKDDCYRNIFNEMFSALKNIRAGEAVSLKQLSVSWVNMLALSEQVFGKRTAVNLEGWFKGYQKSDSAHLKLSSSFVHHKGLTIEQDIISMLGLTAFSESVSIYIFSWIMEKSGFTWEDIHKASLEVLSQHKQANCASSLGLYQ